MADRCPQRSHWVNAVDGMGRSIDPIVLAATEEVAPRALRYGEKLLRDPAVAATLLEESAATVSRAIRIKSDGGTPRVQNLQAYVFRAFVRRVNKARRRDLLLSNNGPLNPGVHHNSVVPSEEIELKVLTSEFLTSCDAVTRDMFYRRIQGFSWKEIARIHGISAHAAESKFSQALRRVRKKLGLDR
jgi:DNA-directed RNA polymerase specialized sigma24 family protein